jgi:hypothetical protein
VPTIQRAEQSLKDLDNSGADCAIKLHVWPVFRTPVFVEIYIDEKLRSAKVKAFRSSGCAGYYEGDVELTFDANVAKAEVWRGIELIEALEHRPMSKEDNYEGCDGTTWTIEIIRNGVYSKCSRWEPEERPTESEYAIEEEYRRVGRWLLDLVGLAPRPVPSENAQQSGAGQPATKPADKVPAKGQPSPPTSKDGPR